MSKSSATAIAETTHPSSKTMPSQHHDPATQTLSSPFVQWPLGVSSPSVFWSRPASLCRMILFTILLLSGVRSVLVNLALCIVFFMSCNGSRGQVLTVTPEGIRCNASVSEPDVEKLVRSVMVCEGEEPLP